MKSGPHLPQLEKALAQKRRPNIAINQSINQSLKQQQQQQQKRFSKDIPNHKPTTEFGARLHITSAVWKTLS